MWFRLSNDQRTLSGSVMVRRSDLALSRMKSGDRKAGSVQGAPPSTTLCVVPLPRKRERIPD